MRKKELKNVALVEAHHVGPCQRPTSIYLRSSFTTGIKGAANGIAQAWHNPNNKISSCHYVVDEVQTLRCVPEHKASYPINTDPYRNAISINVCYNPPDAPSEKVFRDTARLVARLCKLHNINLSLLDDEEFNRWTKHRWRKYGGIITKDLWGVSGEAFLFLVQSEYATL